MVTDGPRPTVCGYVEPPRGVVFSPPFLVLRLLEGGLGKNSPLHEISARVGPSPPLSSARSPRPQNPCGSLMSRRVEIKD